MECIVTVRNNWELACTGVPSWAHDMLDGVNHIFLDFDGVICDSNSFKAANILAAARDHLPEAEAQAFAHYFTHHTGIPREVKTAQYFTDKRLASEILKAYTQLNRDLASLQPTPGVAEFLSRNAAIGLSILSGGDHQEIMAFLSVHKLDGFFQRVLTGPTTKSQHLSSINLLRPAAFVGDAVHDYTVAREFGLRFIFMWGYSQIENAATYTFPEQVLRVENLQSLI